MRRRGPRPLAAALEAVTGGATPATPLARVQAVWTEVVGVAIAAEAQPVSERAGTVTVACRSATWASELELLAPELLDKLNLALGDAGPGAVKALRAKVGKLP
ncbi:MAG TPA: DciA family protein [Thermoleophilaceae bacterium]|nr:DciA family protein [Thermoleophilaceae bacterium]